MILLSFKKGMNYIFKYLSPQYNQRVLVLFLDNDILAQLTPPYIALMNGVPQRRNRTLMNMM